MKNFWKEEHKKAAELLGFDEDEWDDSDDEEVEDPLLSQPRDVIYLARAGQAA